MKGRFFSGGMLLLPVLIALLCLAAAPGRAHADTRVMVVSDLHYLDPSLYEGSTLFLRALRAGDGKITQCGEELMDALYQQILSEKPDALIVTGDLTFNGERKSHGTLAAWFASVEAAGVPVWVIPGNHDINVSGPVGFAEGMYYRTEAETPEDFAAHYAAFTGQGQAGFSCIAPIDSRLWVLMTDVAWYRDGAQTFGLFTGEHAAFLEEALKSAQEAGVRVVTATHHSLIAHTDFSRESYLMFGSEAMASLARRYGVELNLSGHLHIQHIAREEGLADAALGAFCMWPHRYALVTLDDGGALTYDARALDGRFLPEGFLERSRDWFYGIARDKVLASLTGTDEEKAVMADYAARFNLCYFSGTLRRNDPAFTDDPALALWEKQEGSAFSAYMRLVTDEASDDSLHWE